MAVLRIRTREGKEILYPLRSREITIGKNDPAQGIFNDIPLEDLTVSRRHARMIFEKGVWYLAFPFLVVAPLLTEDRCLGVI
jgi:pSer/pThr/pTyr-binding forkhead associated (FHA) protein